MLVSVAVVLIAPAPAYAAASWEEAEQEAGAYTEAPTVLPAAQDVQARSTWISSFISGQYQQRSNWCGPAAAATALTSWHIPGVSQSTLAREMGTDSLGFTPPWRIDDTLNYHWNRYFGGHNVVIYKTYRSVGNDALWNYARSRIYYFQDVLIITVFSRRIWYPNAPGLMGHYLVIYGYTDNWDGRGPTYAVWDPAGGAHHLAKNDWSRVAYTGNFVVAPVY
jgi:hypothetical protein